MSQQAHDREVADTSDRHDEDKKVAEPSRIYIEWILRRFDSAVGESVGDLEALDRPERERRWQDEDSHEQRDSAHDRGGYQRELAPVPFDSEQVRRDRHHDRALRQSSDPGQPELISK